MARINDDKLPCKLEEHYPSGLCPHCRKWAQFVITACSNFDDSIDKWERDVIIGTECVLCGKPIALRCTITHTPRLERVSTFEHRNEREKKPGPLMVQAAQTVERVRPEYEFGDVPPKIRSTIEEALDCYSVEAFNGFAAVCRRALQEICDDLGAEHQPKIEIQINQACIMAKLDDRLKEALKVVMLTGHDGAHANLPSVNQERASLILKILSDVTHELYTRPGRLHTATAARATRQTGIAKRT